MPKRLFDYDAAWGSHKLEMLSLEDRREYFWFFGLAEDNGVFEADPLRIHGRACTLRPDHTPATIARLLDEFARVKLLFRYRAGAKWLGFWIGIEKEGRLPAPAKRKKPPLYPPPPAKQLERFLRAPIRDPQGKLFAPGKKPKASKPEANGFHAGSAELPRIGSDLDSKGRGKGLEGQPGDGRNFSEENPSPPSVAPLPPPPPDSPQKNQKKRKGKGKGLEPGAKTAPVASPLLPPSEEGKPNPCEVLYETLSFAISRSDWQNLKREFPLRDEQLDVVLTAVSLAWELAMCGRDEQGNYSGARIDPKKTCHEFAREYLAAHPDVIKREPIVSVEG